MKIQKSDAETAMLILVMRTLANVTLAAFELLQYARDGMPQTPALSLYGHQGSWIGICHYNLGLCLTK